MKMLYAVEQYKETIRHNPALYACIAAFEKYILAYDKDMSVDTFNVEIIERFLMYGASANTHNSQDMAASCLSALTDLCSFIFEKYRSGQALPSISHLKADEFTRVSFAKQELIKSLLSPVISFSPYVIDMLRYKEYKMKKQTRNHFFEQGFFKVMDIYDGNRLILKKISGHIMFVKVILNIPQTYYLRASDILDIHIKRKAFSSSWEIAKIRDCYPKGMEKLAYAGLQAKPSSHQ